MLLTQYATKFLTSTTSNDNVDFLYDKNQYFIKRFFELIFENEDYRSSVLLGDTKLFRETYSTAHCTVLRCACVVSLQSELDIDIFKNLYLNYIDHFSKSLYFTARNEWHEFTLTILQHLIWTRKPDEFIWVMEHGHTLVQKILRTDFQYVDNTRKYFYRNLWNQINVYMFRFSIFSDRLSVCQDLVRNGTFSVNYYSRKTALKLGYEFSKHYQTKKIEIYPADFANTREWKWLNKCASHEGLDVIKCIDICIKSGFDKTRLVDLFHAMDADVFWKFFVAISKKHLKFLTSRLISRIIVDSKFKVTDETLKRTIILKLFDISATMSKSLVFYVVDCLSDYKISLSEAVPIVQKLYHKNLKFSQLEVVSKICKLCVDHCTNDISFDDEMLSSPDAIYFSYSCFGEIMNQFLNKITPISGDCDCAICLSELSSEKCVTLPCKHRFHQLCVVQDFNARFINRSTYRCPLCRIRVHPLCLK